MTHCPGGSVRGADVDEDNDGRFPDDSAVEIRYPRTRQEELADRCGMAVAAWLDPKPVRAGRVARVRGSPRTGQAGRRRPGLRWGGG